MEFHLITNESIKDCFSFTDIVKKFNYKYNGRITGLIKKYTIQNNIDTSHFKTIKYKKIIKICPNCKKSFGTKKESPDEKITCSRSCANSYFRSGTNHPNWKEESTNYRTKINIVHCERCDYNSNINILQVHHKNRNRKDNSKENLEVLCPNCHCIEHLKDLQSDTLPTELQSQ